MWCRCVVGLLQQEREEASEASVHGRVGGRAASAAYVLAEVGAGGDVQNGAEEMAGNGLDSEAGLLVDLIQSEGSPRGSGGER